MTSSDNIERFKKIVDAIFDDIDNPKPKATEKIATVPSTAKKKLNVEKVDVEEDEVCDLGIAEETVELILKELDDVREAFLKFQEDVEDLAIFQFLFPEIEEFVEFCLDLVELIEDDFDVESLDSKSLEQYQKMQKLRARILSAAYMKYKKE